MKRRSMKGIPKLAVSFGEPDPNPFAPLHRRLGIVTYVHRQAVLHDIIALGRGTKSTNVWAYDPQNRVWSSSHLFRASVTLAGVACTGAPAA